MNNDSTLETDVRNLAASGLMQACKNSDQFWYEGAGSSVLTGSTERYDGAEIIVDFLHRTAIVRTWFISHHNGDHYGMKEHDVPWAGALQYLHCQLERDCYDKLVVARQQDAIKREQQEIMNEFDAIRNGTSNRRFNR